MASETPTSEEIHFFCRARFMRLDVPKKFDDSPGQKPRWEATFILDPSDKRGQEGIVKVLDTAARMSKETYGKVPLALKKLRAKFVAGSPKLDLNDPANVDDGIKIAFLDGDTKTDYSGYAGMFIVPAHNSKLQPAVANRLGKKVLPGEPQYPYDGCYAIGAISIWIQVGETRKKYGDRVGVNLRGVQFHSPGDAFTQDVIQAEDTFVALGDEDGAAPAASGSDWD